MKHAVIAMLAATMALSGCATITELIENYGNNEPEIENPDKVDDPVEISETEYPWKGKLIKDITKDGNKRSTMASINYKETQPLDFAKKKGAELKFSPAMTYWSRKSSGKDEAMIGVMIELSDGSFACAHFAGHCPKGRDSLAWHDLQDHSTLDINQARRIWVYLHNYKGSRTEFCEVDR